PTIQVLPISVAAFMTADWIAKHIRIPPETARVVVPGCAGGDFGPLAQRWGVTFERGPRDLRELPIYFGRNAKPPADYGRHDLEIVAEINHAPRRSLDDLIAEARRLADDGADVIDLGCDPGPDPWQNVADGVRALRQEGLRVSIDSLDPREITPAVAAGAELVFSVNRSNRHAGPDWGCEVVAIPDDPRDLASLRETMEYLASQGVPFRIDPILEPIGFGFAASLRRYWEMRTEFPATEMCMGVGNLTELTDVDSAGINVLLLAICQELGIRSVLTTEVIPWASSSVRECDLARRLVHYSVTHGELPKHIEPRLIALRDPVVARPTLEELRELAGRLRDPNVRIFVDGTN
ncbi:MAG TPA: DUF6513 domain-containing protein, partial [Pirellulaceae bacterium]